MDEYFFHLMHILDDGLQCRDIVPILMIAAMAILKMRYAKPPVAKK